MYSQILTIMSALAIIMIIIMVIFLIIERRKSILFKEQVKHKNQTVNQLYKNIESLSNDKDLMEERIKYLEDIKGEAFQVKLRQEVVNVNVDFTKLEMVLIISGIHVLLKKTDDPDDAKEYIKLIEKINGFIGNMKEGEEPIDGIHT